MTTFFETHPFGEETDRAIFDTLSLKGEAKRKHEQLWKETTIKEYMRPKEAWPRS